MGEIEITWLLFVSFAAIAALFSVLVFIITSQIEKSANKIAEALEALPRAQREFLDDYADLVGQDFIGR